MYNLRIVRTILLQRMARQSIRELIFFALNISIFYCYDIFANSIEDSQFIKPLVK